MTTHWITRGEWDTDLLGIVVDNVHTPSECRRGPESLPLQEVEWNRVSMTLDDGTLRISLHDMLVFEGPAQGIPDPLFGLYRLQQ